MTVDLDHLERLRAEATDGPWECRQWSDYGEAGRPVIAGGHGCYIVVDDRVREPDAAWIVAITNAAPELLAEVRELRKLRDSLADQVVRSRQDGRAARAALAESERHNLTHLQMYEDSQAELRELRTENERLANELKARGLAHVVTRGGAA